MNIEYRSFSPRVPLTHGLLTFQTIVVGEDEVKRIYREGDVLFVVRGDKLLTLHGDGVGEVIPPLVTPEGVVFKAKESAK